MEKQKITLEEALELTRSVDRWGWDLTPQANVGNVRIKLRSGTFLTSGSIELSSGTYAKRLYFNIPKEMKQEYKDLYYGIEAQVKERRKKLREDSKDPNYVTNQVRIVLGSLGR